MNNEIEYEPVTKLAAAVAKGIYDTWVKLGKPDDPKSSSFWVVIDTMVQVWEKYYPQEVARWKYERSIELGYERSVHVSLALGGYSPAAFPPTLYSMMHSFFPMVKFHEKKLLKKLMSRYPLFRISNHA